jgi:hypothetical protein
MTIPIKSNMQVQSGATLSATGTGVIDATAIQGTTVSGTTGTGNAVLSASPSLTGTTSAVNISVSGTLADGTSSVGTSGQILSSTVTGTAWISQSSLSIAYSQVTGTPQSAQTFTAVTNEFLTSYTAGTGLFTAAQPSFSNLSGSIATGQIPSSTITIAQLASTEGSGSKVQLTNASTTVSGDVVTYDGSGNVQDSGTLLSSLATTSSLSAYATLASPTFTGTVTLPTVTLSGVMTVGTGASISVTGTGSVEATQLWAVVVSSAAPSNGQVLTATSTTAAAWQTPQTIVATGSNVVIAAQRTSSTDSGYSTLSALKQLKSGQLLWLPASWKFSLVFSSGAGYVVNAVIYRTLIDSTTIVDSTAVTWGGLSTGNIGPTAGEHFSDAISLQLDTNHDYYIAIYFQSGSGNLTIWSPGAVLQNNYYCGYVSGNKTTLTTGGTIPSVSPEETVYRVIAS